MSKRTEYPVIKTSKLFEGQLNDLTIEKLGSWRFHPDGIFSTVIFGPLLDYVCDCNKILPKGTVCEHCGVESQPSIVRNTVIAQINLVEPIIHPFINYILYHNHYFIIPQNYILYDENEIYTYTTNIPERTPMHQSLIMIAMYAIYKQVDFMQIVEVKYSNLKGYFEYYTPEQYLKVAQKVLDEITNPKLLTNMFDNVDIEDIVIKRLLVLPAGLRQMQLKQFDAQKLINTNKLNLFYYKIIKTNETIETLASTNYQTLYLHHRLAQLAQQYWQELILQLIKKKGLIRRYKLGRRINFSTRAVLVGDASLGYDEIRVSYLSGIQLCYLPLVKKLIYEYNYSFDDAHELLMYTLETYQVPQFIKDILNSLLPQYVLFLRQPVLHLPSTMQAKIVEFTDDLIIATNQLIWSGLNADSDGDTFGLFWLPEPRNNFSIQKHIFTPRNELNYAIEYDSLLGWYTFAQNQKN